MEMEMEPKQEPPEDDRGESPLIRVCDTPSSTRSLQSPGLDHHHSPDQSSPGTTTLPMFSPIFPLMMFLNPYLGLPLQRFPSLPLPPILPPHLQQHNETEPFSIDNILKSVQRPVSLSPPVETIKDPGSLRTVSKTRSMSSEDMKPESPLMEMEKLIQLIDGETPPGVTKDADCPPGMVRGPNGKLVLACVFCT